MSPEDFAKIEFRFAVYLDPIYAAGGYIWLDQLLHSYGEVEGRYIAKKLQAENLIKTKTTAKYKIACLADQVMKYYAYKDCDDDLSVTPKTELNYNKLSLDISEKTLMSSGMIYALIMEGICVGKIQYKKYLTDYLNNKITSTIQEKINDINKNLTELSNAFDKENIKLVTVISILQNYTNEVLNTKIEDLECGKKQLQNELEEIKLRTFKKDRCESIKDGINEINKQIEVSKTLKPIIEKYFLIREDQDEIVSDRIAKKEELKKYNLKLGEANKSIDEIIKKAEVCYKQSKIIFFPEGEKMNAIILDTGTTDDITRSIKVISTFLKQPILNNLQCNIAIVSYSENRATFLVSQLDELHTKIKHAEEFVTNCEMNYQTYSEHYKNAKELIGKYVDFRVDVWDKCYYMNKYKSYISSLSDDGRFDKKNSDIFLSFNGR